MLELSPKNEVNKSELSQQTKIALTIFLSQYKGVDPTDIYELFLHEIEQPLLDITMQYARGNQSRAARILGINRGTLLKKLKYCNLA